MHDTVTQKKAPSIVRQISVLSLGLASAQATMLLGGPILARLFTPSEFGALGAFTAVAMIFGNVACLRFELAINIARSHKQALAVAHLCLVTAIVTAGTISALSLLLIPWLPNVPQARSWTISAGFLAINLASSGLHLALSQWCARQEAFRVVAASAVIRAISTIVTQCLLGLTHWGYLGLLAGHSIGQVAATAFTYSRIGKGDRSNLIPSSPSIRRLKLTAYRFRRFATFSTPQEFLNVISQQTPSAVLLFIFGAEEVGLYWFAFRFALAPAILIGQPLRQVYYTKTCQLVNQGASLNRFAAVATLTVFLVGCIALLPIAFNGEQIFTFLFGCAWRPSGEMARWISIWALFGLSNIPSFCTLQALGAQRALLWYEAALFVVRNGSLTLVAINASAIDAVAAWALSGVVMNVILILLGLRAARKSMGSLIT